MASDLKVDQCLSALASVYPNHFRAWTTPEQLRAARAIYHRIWRDIGDDLLEAATTQWLSTAHPFHPSPGELRDLALSLITRNEPSADEAWIEVSKAMHDVGYYGVPTWSSDRVARCVRALGSWKDLCATPLDQLAFIRSQFMNIYKAQVEREKDAQLMLPETKQQVEALLGATAKRLTGRTE